MNEIKKAINALYEERRNAARGQEKAHKAGNRILEQRFKREVARLDDEIKNLESK